MPHQPNPAMETRRRGERHDNRVNSDSVGDEVMVDPGRRVAESLQITRPARHRLIPSRAEQRFDFHCRRCERDVARLPISGEHQPDDAPTLIDHRRPGVAARYGTFSYDGRDEAVTVIPGRVPRFLDVDGRNLRDRDFAPARTTFVKTVEQRRPDRRGGKSHPRDARRRPRHRKHCEIAAMIERHKGCGHTVDREPDRAAKVVGNGDDSFGSCCETSRQPLDRPATNSGDTNNRHTFGTRRSARRANEQHGRRGEQPWGCRGYGRGHSGNVLTWTGQCPIHGRGPGRDIVVR